ncbi:hypothetical protein [Pyxidicoccus xibeiensis]|uniref:hypothetical protein n=1 Tax=Pyxidicoccus xibeiensis TaxID=2906759 RepID=UPI0020A7FDEE|nr:hypothetical protein [Pyxidicoccus xibeiensis]MCP3141410.1 hypothetical protein [Pyxidicoccus xibeiensis]
MSNSTEPRQLPPEPPEVIAKREKLVTDLDAEAKKAQGTFLQVVRTMKMLVTSTAPSQPFDPKLYGDVKDALARFMKDPIIPPPAILGQVVEYLQYRLSTYGMTIQNAVMEMNPEMGKKMQFTVPGAPAAAAPAPAPKQAAPAAKAKDGFESSGGSSRPLALNPEAVPPPADPKAEQQQLESFKAWMKNPNLGKLKG